MRHVIQELDYDGSFMYWSVLCRLQMVWCYLRSISFRWWAAFVVGLLLWCTWSAFQRTEWKCSVIVCGRWLDEVVICSATREDFHFTVVCGVLVLLCVFAYSCITYTGCPTTYQTRRLFNNYKPKEDISTRFVQKYDRRWEMKRNVSVVHFKFRCNILIRGKIIKELPGLVGSGTLCIFLYFNLSIPFSVFQFMLWMWDRKLFHELAKVKSSLKSCRFNDCFLMYRYLISSLILVVDAFCWVNLDAGVVFGIFIMGKRYNEHLHALKNNSNSSKFSQHLNERMHTFRSIENFMQILNYQKKRPKFKHYRALNKCKRTNAHIIVTSSLFLNPLAPSDPYMSRTA
jgi:hypothetical protein